MKLRSKHRGTLFEKSKHWNITERMEIAVSHARILGLHRASPKRVLDLGAGCGYFAYVCNYYGHEATGVDVQRTYVP
ncbi:hypothetical protein L0156_29985 [bacterium]|nr:hypothetical protein [bacterium]